MDQPSGCSFPVLVSLITMIAVLLFGGIVATETGNLLPSEPEVESISANPLLAQIDEAEAQWIESGLDSYTIVVRDARFIGLQTHTIIVQNGEVIESSATCEGGLLLPNGECTLQEFNPDDYTIPGLFARARATASIDDGQFTEIEYDPMYHFPLSIYFDNPEIMDEQWAVTVESFEPEP